MSTAALQVPLALTGAPLPVAYGPARVSGNELLNYQLADNSHVILRILGEGPWDGIDRLWINAKLVDITDVNLVHFHNGFDGTLGAGLAPASNGGDQLVDNFFSLLPANYQRLTYSRKAYLMVHVAQDPQAPSPNVDIIGDYRTMRVRIFDAAGVQTAFQYTTNPAWQILDVKIRQMLQREWTTSGAAAAGGDLSADQKARIDFAAWADAAAWCDFDIGGGIKRFEGGVAYPQLVSLQQVANQLCTLSQTYIVESAGKIGLYPDRARASSFTLTSDHITAASFIPSKTQLRGAQNRFIATFRDLNPQKNADIDTSANTGLSRTGGVLTVKVPAGQVHGFLVNDNVDIVNPDTASFAGTIKVTTVISSTQFSGAQAGANATSGGGYVGTTESRFAQRTKIVDHEQHQLAVGQRGLNLTPVHRRTPVSMDLGNNTMERVERILNFVKARNLGADVAPYSAPFTAEVQASMYSVDGGGNALIAQLPGDIITIDKSVSEEYQGDYEITPRIRYNRAGSSSSVGDSAGQSAQADTIDLTLKQYLPGAFSDVADLAQYLVASSGQNGNLYRFAPSQYIPSAVPGAATLTDIPKGIDGDQSTFAEFKITSAGGGSAPELSAWYATFPAIKGKWKSLTLYVKSSVPTNTSVNGGSTVRLDYYKIFTGSSAVGTSGGTIFTTGAGATRAITTDSVVLPLDVNLGQVAVFIDVLSFLEAAGVILTMRIYDVWIDAVV